MSHKAPNLRSSQPDVSNWALAAIVAAFIFFTWLHAAGAFGDKFPAKSDAEAYAVIAQMSFAKSVAVGTLASLTVTLCLILFDVLTLAKSSDTHWCSGLRMGYLGRLLMHQRRGFK